MIQRLTWSLLLGVVFQLSAASTTHAADLVEVNVYPTEVHLTSQRAYQTVIVQGIYADGITRDLTSQAQWTFANEGLLKLDGNKLLPVADGETTVSITVQGQTVTVPATVSQAQTDRPVSFNLDVMPIFMKASCNTGSCHGAARGKDGFMLSLFGYDAKGDHYRITQELLGRRINLGVPEASLIVEKSVGAVPHTGGKLFDMDSPMSKTLIEWIENGVPSDPADQAKCVDIQLYPRQAVLDGKGEQQQVVVIGKYSDGTYRDLTSLSAFFSNNDSSASIDPTGKVTAGDRGEAFIMARFDIFTVGSQYLTLPSGLEFTATVEEPANYIDELVNDKLEKIRLNPSEVCTDEEFLRRVYIDLIGLFPTHVEYNEFMADADPEKRTKKIDELLNRKEFTEIWVSKWAEWLMMRSGGINQISDKSIVQYYQWLVNEVANNVPTDEMVRKILSASGGTFSSPATNFYELERDQLKVAENVAQVFMGMQIQCAQCHNHPFDRWTQNEYYDFASFFSQIGRKRAEDLREQIIFNRGGGEVTHPVTGQPGVPKFLGGDRPDTAGKDRREVLANWLASPENPFFAPNFANRIWHHFFGIGIVDPVDDFRVSNPASNPELLDALAAKFIEYNYDFKKLVRDICMSKTYQRSTKRNETNLTDEKNFAHQNVRRIKAESMLDIISQVTQTRDDFDKLPVGATAVQIADGATTTYFLETFGRARRETVCSCEVRMEPTLSQALHLLNGDTVNAKMQQGELLKKLKEEGLAPLEIVDRLYVSCFTRHMTPDERARMEPMFAEGANVDQALEDIYWAVLNSREFLFNH